MNDTLEFFMDKTDNSKFIATAFDSYDSLINYQVKMITNNKIRYLLPTAMQQTDNRVVLYYDTTNKISLSNYIKKERLNKEQFLSLLNTLVKIDDEIDEFQLINSGLIFKPDKVFVDLDGYNCEYIYIPNAKEPNDAKEIKDYLMELLKNGYIDAGAQELVVSLFTLLQNEDISIRDIKDLIYRFEGRNKRPSLKREEAKQEKNYTNESNRENVQSSIPPIKNINSKPVPKPILKKNDTGDKKSIFKREKPVIKPKAVNEEADSLKNENEEKSTLPITLTVCGNVVAVAGIYKIYTLGALNGEAGIDITKLAAIVLAVVVIDIIVIKNLFLNNNSKAEKPKKVKAEKKKKIKKAKEPKVKNLPFAENAEKQESNKPEIPQIKPDILPKGDNLHLKAAVLPELNKKPEIPKAEKIEAANDKKPEIPTITNEVKNESMTDISNDNILPEKDINFASETVLLPSNNDFGIEFDETVLMVNNEPKGYIERFEDGKIADKYVIKKDKVIIGRLRSQVDMTVLNPKVGKIHAEISCKNGEFYIKDLYSKNGIYLNDETERIKSDIEYKLNDGDKFKLADSMFCIYFIK